MRALAAAAILTGLLLLGLSHLSVQAEEPNNDIQTATRLVSGTEVTDGINTTTDEVDWFVISASKGQVLNVTVFTLDYPALNLSLEVYDRYGTRQGYSLSENRYECVMIVAASNGDHFMRVFVEPGNGGGKYTLTVTVSEPHAIWQGTPQRGTLHNDTNHPADIYKLFLDAGQIVTARMTEAPLPSLDAVNIDLYLMDLWPTADVYGYLDVSWWSDPLEIVRAKAPHEGYYFIIVSAFNGSGTYELSMSIDTSGTPGGDDFPPEAKALFARATVNGSVDQGMDHYDFFRLNPSEGESLVVDLALVRGASSGIFEMDLLDANMRFLWSGTNYLYDPARVTESINLTWKFQTAGVHYIVVAAKWGLSPFNPADLSDAPASADYIIDFKLQRENQPPYVAHPLPVLGVQEDTPLTGVRLDTIFEDPNTPDGDSLTYSATGSAHVTVIRTGPAELSLVPAENWSGREDLFFVATDSMGLSSTLKVVVTVNPVNDAPYVVSAPESTVLEWGRAYPAFINLSALFSDPDTAFGDMLSYRISVSQLGLYMEPPGFLSSGALSAEPGTYIVTLSAGDRAGLEISTYLNITVTRSPRAPVAAAPVVTLEMDEDSTGAGLELLELFQDSDGGALEFRFWGQDKLSVSLQDGRVSVQAPQDWSGTEDVFLEARNEHGLLANCTLHVTVRPVEDAPRLVGITPSGNFAMEQGADRTLRVVATDPETPLQLVYSWDIDGKNVNASTRSGNVLTLKSLGAGNHVVVVTVRDAAGLSVTATWAVTVTEKPAPAVSPETERANTAGGAVVAVGVSSWLLAFIGISEQGKYVFLKWLIIPLYTKIRKEEVLDHFVRGRIYGIVESNPGVHYTLIKKKTGVGNGTLTYHLSTLEREGFIRSEWDGLYKRFYPAQMPRTNNGEVLELSRVQAELLELVRLSPGSSQKELCEKTGLSKRVISYHIAQMVDARVIRIERDGKRVRCYVLEEAS